MTLISLDLNCIVRSLPQKSPYLQILHLKYPHKFELLLFNIYNVPSQMHLMLLPSEIRSVLLSPTTRVVSGILLLGNFNLHPCGSNCNVITSEDLEALCHFSHTSVGECFNSLVCEFNLSNCYDTGSFRKLLFTFIGRGLTTTIDYCFVSPSLAPKVCKVEVGDFVSSDHLPLIITMDSSLGHVPNLWYRLLQK